MGEAILAAIAVLEFSRLCPIEDKGGPIRVARLNGQYETIVFLNAYTSFVRVHTTLFPFTFQWNRNIAESYIYILYSIIYVSNFRQFYTKMLAVRTIEYPAVSGPDATHEVINLLAERWPHTWVGYSEFATDINASWLWRTWLFVKLGDSSQKVIIWVHWKKV